MPPALRDVYDTLHKHKQRRLLYEMKVEWACPSDEQRDEQLQFPVIAVGTHLAGIWQVRRSSFAGDHFSFTLLLNSYDKLTSSIQILSALASLALALALALAFIHS